MSELMFAPYGVTGEISDKITASCAAFALVTAYCHGINKTSLIEPKDKSRFAWFDDLKVKLDAVKAVANEWINDIYAGISASIPDHVIEYNSQFQASAEMILDFCNRNPHMKNGDPEFNECYEVLQALIATINYDVLIDISSYEDNIEAWGIKFQTAYGNLKTKIIDIQKSETGLQSEIDRLSKRIGNLQSVIDNQNHLISVGSGFLYGGIIVELVGVCLLATGVGSAAGGLVIGEGVCMVVGGAITSGNMASKIKRQYDEIAGDKKNTLENETLLVALKGIETASSSAVTYMQQAQSALSGVKATWTGLKDTIEKAVNDLDKAEESATAVIKRLFTNAAIYRWDRAQDEAQTIIANRLEIRDKGTIGDKATS
jgi:hypothetical protein